MLSLRRYLLVALLAVACFGAANSGVYAYNLLGGNWSSGDFNNLAIWVHHTWDSDTETAFNIGLSDFEQLTDFGYSDVGCCSMKVDFGDVDEDTSWDGLAVLNPCLSCSPYQSGSWSVLNYHWTQGYNLNAKVSVAVHEVGHILGLDHESGAVLMNGSTCGTNSRWCTYGINTPQGDDVDGIEAIYN